MTPARRLLVVVGAVTLCAAPLPLYPLLLPFWNGLAGIVAGVVLLDLLLCGQGRQVTLRRVIPGSIPAGRWSTVDLTLENRGRRPLGLQLHDHHPPWFDVQSLPLTLRLPAGRTLRCSYRVRPSRRGNGQFPGADLLVRSPLGLWVRRRFLQLPCEVRVFPDYRQAGHRRLMAGELRLSRRGVHRHRRRGEGSDFQQLREYRTGDSMRRVDWKASSRYRRLISREYQEERDQQLLFLLDCGRRMRHREAGRAHLDQVLEAMLLLTRVAARQGDAVGLLTFGGERRWLPPGKGMDLVRRFLLRSYDIESTTEAADYLQAARELMHLQRRRALVVLLTNTRDEDYADLIPAVRLLQRRHLVLVANLRESLLDDTIVRPVRDLEGALMFQAVNGYLGSRHRSLEALRHQGALALDLLAPQLPEALVGNYLSIKASGAL
ncbi:MAG TPA: DUF58 domain-containing protein [Sedimenticola sp.]|nr:DUF58 domain-containing protein [Sedimenticola sp.]